MNWLEDKIIKGKNIGLGYMKKKDTAGYEGQKQYDKLAS